MGPIAGVPAGSAACRACNALVSATQFKMLGSSNQEAYKDTIDLTISERGSVSRILPHVTGRALI